MVVNSLSMLMSNMIQKDPGVIVGPIAGVLGVILNGIFGFVSSLTLANSLGISIIILTIVTRAIMLPLAFKQQKSMAGMQKIQPEVEKIKKKYGTSKDPEVQQKMNADIQKLYSKHKINPLGGCLPLLVQMPIFVALSHIMQNSYLYIGQVGEVYRKLADTVIGIEGYFEFVKPIGLPKIPNKMELDIALVENMEKLLNKFNEADWTLFLQKLPTDAVNQLNEMLTQKAGVEYFLGINLVEASGYGLPGILIPILSAVTTFLSSYILSKQNTSTDPNAKMQQKVMLIVMPIMMGFMTVGFPAGVGLYWITSSVFQLFQQILLNRYYMGGKKEEA